MSHAFALRGAAIATALVLAPLAAVASAPPAVITNGYVRTVPAEWKTTAAYMTIRNPTDKPMVLTSASSPLCTRVELHSVRKDRHGKPVMTQAGRFVVPAKGELILTPGGDHLMLVGLVRELEPSVRVPLTLTFETKAMTLELPAEAMGPMVDLVGAPGNKLMVHSNAKPYRAHARSTPPPKAPTPTPPNGAKKP